MLNIGVVISSGGNVHHCGERRFERGVSRALAGDLREDGGEVTGIADLI